MYNELFSNIISICIIVFFIYPFLRYLEDRQTIYLWLGIGAFLADGSTFFIKLITANMGSHMERPKGAKDCNIFCNNGHVSGRAGFPSGHMTTIAFFFTFLYLITPTEKQSSVAVTGIIATALMAYARMQKRCHNLLQTAGGVVYGAVFAYAWWRLAMQYNNEEKVLKAIRSNRD